MSELFTAVGFGARILGRAPLLVRYLWAGKTLHPDSYIAQRYGTSWRWRPWLILDAGELEVLERLINDGTDEQLLAFRKSHIGTASSTGVVGGLLVSASAAILALPSLSEIHWFARFLFFETLMLSLLSVYFALLLQRELSMTDAHALRLWLWDGTTYNSPHGDGQPLWRSSLSSNHLLQAPFEFLNISISCFLGGLSFYLGLAYASKVTLSLGSDSNFGTLVAFVVTTFFSLAVFGQSLGEKDRELARCKSAAAECGFSRHALAQHVPNDFGSSGYGSKAVDTA